MTIPGWLVGIKYNDLGCDGVVDPTDPRLAGFTFTARAAAAAQGERLHLNPPADTAHRTALLPHPGCAGQNRAASDHPSAQCSRLAPQESATASDAPSVITLLVTPNRCDPHAIAEDKRGTVFPISVILDDGTTGRQYVASADVVRAALYDVIGMACG